MTPEQSGVKIYRVKFDDYIDYNYFTASEVLVYTVIIQQGKTKLTPAREEKWAHQTIEIGNPAKYTQEIAVLGGIKMETIHVTVATAEQMRAVGWIPESFIEMEMERRKQPGAEYLVGMSRGVPITAKYYTPQEEQYAKNLELVRDSIERGNTSINEIVKDTKLSINTVIKYRRILRG